VGEPSGLPQGRPEIQLEECGVTEPLRLGAGSIGADQGVDSSTAEAEADTDNRPVAAGRHRPVQAAGSRLPEPEERHTAEERSTAPARSTYTQAEASGRRSTTSSIPVSKTDARRINLASKASTYSNDHDKVRSGIAWISQGSVYERPSQLIYPSQTPPDPKTRLAVSRGLLRNCCISCTRNPRIELRLSLLDVQPEVTLHARHPPYS